MNKNKIKIAAMKLVFNSNLPKQEKLELLELIKEVDDFRVLSTVFESYCLRDQECPEVGEKTRFRKRGEEEPEESKEETKEEEESEEKGETEEEKEEEKETIEERRGMSPLVFSFFRKKPEKVTPPPPSKYKIEKSKRISRDILRFRPGEVRYGN